MAKYQQYEEYKNSGIEWLGKIPHGWKVLRGKYVFQEFRERSTTGEEVLLSVSEYYGVKPRSEKISEGDHLSRAESLVDYKKCYKNDLVMNIMLAWKRGLGVSKYDGIVSPAYSVFRFNKDIHPYFMHHLFRTDLYTSHFKTRSTGVIDSRLRLYPESFLDTEILIPSYDEQAQIANFLDHETAQIDTLIEKQKTLIQLLKEKRQAVISHAVTKGLNPDATMKDSGVEWLGEVPEHWVVSSLKYHVDTVNGFGFSSSDVCEEGVPFIRAGNIKEKSITPTDLYLPQKVVNKYKRVILFEGDIVISMVGSDPKILKSAVGQIGVVPKSMAGAVPNQNIVILREKSHSILKRFLFYTLCSDSYRNHLNVFSHKLANQSIISSSLIINAKFMLPSSDEQYQVVEFLDKRLVKMDEVIEKNYISLELLKERRTALISAAVTGKIDVRGWVAPE